MRRSSLQGGSLPVEEAGRAARGLRAETHDEAIELLAEAEQKKMRANTKSKRSRCRFKSDYDS